MSHSRNLISITAKSMNWNRQVDSTNVQVFERDDMQVEVRYLIGRVRSACLTKSGGRYPIAGGVPAVQDVLWRFGG